jgi:hypothetical protein
MCSTFLKAVTLDNFKKVTAKTVSFGASGNLSKKFRG